jgi:gliding motility-associated-like protein
VVSPSIGVSVSGNTVTAPAGTYTVTATLGACTSIASAIVTVNAQPAIPNAPTSGGNQTVCSNGTTNQTLTAAATGGSITWYDAATAGNIVTSPTQVGVGTKTYYAQASNGTCSSLTRTAVTLTIASTLAQPTSGAVTQPTCSTATGSFSITNYNASYTYVVSPSIGVSVSGNTVTAPAGTYTVTATLGACTSIASASVTINTGTPTAPVAGTVTQPTCSLATGSFSITNYNASYTYVVSPSTGVSVSGNTVSAPAGTYTVTATFGACSSIVSASVTVNAQSATLAAATLGTVTQPTGSLATGSFSITNYNASYTYVVSPSIGVSVSGNTVTAPAGTYTVTATLGACTSIVSASVIINEQPPTLDCSKKNMLISKVLTPNNDGFNDYFKITGLEGCSFTFGIKIFNRWGKIVYQSDNYQNDWNGKFDGSGIQIGSNMALSRGTYFYIVTVSGGNGFKPVSGYFYLGANQ